MSLSGLPFDDIRDLIKQLPEGDLTAGQLAKTRSDDLAETFGVSEKHTTLCEWLAIWSGKSPKVSRPMLALFAGNHAVTDRLETLYGEDTIETVTRLAAGGGTANQACAGFDIGLKVFDLALQYPVADIGYEDALDEKGSAATIGFGMEAIAGGVDVLGLAAFGKGSQIANLVLMSLLLDKAIDPTAIGQAELALVEEVVKRNKGITGDPLELLRRIGGREHSAITGAVLAARVNHVPVILEGMTAASIVLLLQKIDPGLCDHCCFAAKTSSKSDLASNYGSAVEQSNLHVVLDGFGIAGDGANAALAIGLLKSVAAMHSDSVIASSQ